jgi:uncharacterized protein YjbI with pentapeptide repeats
VLAGDEIKQRSIPPRYIVRILSEAELQAESGQPRTQVRNQEDWKNAWLRLTKCRIEQIDQEQLEVIRSLRPLSHYGPETQKHLLEDTRGSRQGGAGRITLRIDFEDVEVRSNVALDGIVVQAPITFENVHFMRNASFQGTVFEQDARFLDVQFDGISDFSRILVLQNLSFNNCYFAREALFSTSTITHKGNFYLSGHKIDVPLDFSGSTVLGHLTLEGRPQTLQLATKVYMNGINASLSEPSGELNVKNAEFRDEFYLDRSKWQGLDFGESERGFHRPIRFLGSCDLRHMVSNIANFGGAEFEGHVDLTGTEFRQIVIFERVKFRQPVQLHWKQIAGRLGKFDSRNESQMVRVKADNLTEVDKQTYDELEQNFRAVADLRSANECHFQNLLFSNGRGLRWAVLGYEVHPLNPFVTLSLLLVLFCGLNAYLFRHGIFSGGTWQRWISRPLKFTLHTLPLWSKAFPAGYKTTALGRITFWTEFGFTKILWLAFILAWMNKSPLLKEFIPYFWSK